MKHDLENRVQCQIPLLHPMRAWLAEYSSMPVTNFQTGKDCKTAYQRLHGQASRDRLPYVGETAMFFIPKHSRGDADPRWNFGVFLGRAWASDQNRIGLSDGTVTRARALARTIDSKRWQPQRCERIRAVPWKEKPKKQDALKESPSPTSHLSPCSMNQSMKTAIRPSASR